jgi:prolyl-tRNA editing enzyme YbaK/EbsC (Cys-tRNA(Pro) deacylase)
LGSLNTSAQRIQDILSGMGLGYRVIEFPTSTRTAQEAADRVGCQIGQIVKSMVFRGQTSGEGILVLTSGLNRVDEKKIGVYTGEDVERADPDFVRMVTGFAIGGVPPIGHLQPLETFIDEDLLNYPSIWAAAGTPNAVFEMKSTDLVRITRGIAITVKQE